MAFKRILIASNYDDESFNEEFLNVPPVEEARGQSICNSLNSIDSAGRRYYKLVVMDYVPSQFQP